MIPAAAARRGSAGLAVRRLLAAVVVGACWFPGPVSAQAIPDSDVGPGFWFVPSVRVAGAREDNLLLSQERAGATFTRVTPTVELRYRAPLHTVDAAYTVDSERYPAARRVLNNAFARQAVAGAFESRPTPRTLLSGRLRYVSTVRPEDALELTGLVLARRRTTGLAGDAAVDRRLSPRLRTRLAYTLGAEDYGPPTDARPSAKSTLHAATAGVAFLLDPRTDLRVDYTGRLLFGDDLRLRSIVKGEFTAHAVTVRLSRAITPRLEAVVLAGPRLSQTLPGVIPAAGEASLDVTLAPEVLASLTYRDGVRRVSAAYARSQFMGFGASGFVDTESFEVRAAAVIARRVQVSARPALYRNSLAAARATSYRVDLGTSIQAWRWLSVDASYVYRHQDRSLTLADIFSTGLNPRTRHSILAGVTVRRPVRID